jgi:hypothetical protein
VTPLTTPAKNAADGAHPPETEPSNDTSSVPDREASGISISGGEDPSDTPEPEAPVKAKGLTLESLRKSTSAGNAIPAINPVSTAVVIEVRKPTKAPIRAHPSDDYTLVGYALAVKEANGVGDAIYLVDPDVAGLIPRHIRMMRFNLCFDGWLRRPFIWPITVQVEGGRGNSWNTSSMRIWGAAKERWVCCIGGGGAYELHEPSIPMKGEPTWPNKTFEELMMMAFRDLYIDDPLHPEVVKRLTVLIPE